MKTVLIVLCIYISSLGAIKLFCKGHWERNDAGKKNAVDSEKVHKLFANQMNQHISLVDMRLNDNDENNKPKKDEIEEGEDDIESLVRGEANIFRRELKGIEEGLTDALIATVDQQKTAAVQADISVIAAVVSDEPSDNKSRVLEENPPAEMTEQAVKIVHEDDNEKTKDDLDQDIGLGRQNKGEIDIMINCILDGEMMQQIQTVNMICRSREKEYKHSVYLGGGSTDLFVFPLENDIGQIEFSKEYKNINYLSYYMDPRSCKVLHTSSVWLLNAAGIVLTWIIAFW